MLIRLLAGLGLVCDLVDCFGWFVLRVVVGFVIGDWLFGCVDLGLLLVVNSVVLQWFFVRVVWFVDFTVNLLWFRVVR